jgi:hypothetical protein
MLSFGGLSYEFGVGSNSVGIGISVEGDNIVLSVSHTEYTDNVYTRTTTNYSINRTVAGLAVAGIALGGEAVAIVSGGAVIIEKVFAH